MASGCYSPFPHLNTKTNNNNSKYMKFAAIQDTNFAKRERKSFFIFKFNALFGFHTLSASLLLNTRRHDVQTGAIN